MPSTCKLVLFEDTANVQSAVFDALKKYLGTTGEVLPFDPGTLEKPADQDRMYEDRIETLLSQEPYRNTTLVLADRDLSKSSAFRGLSVNAVATAAGRLGLPLCSYAREPATDDYDWRGRWEEGHIVLSFARGEDELARRTVLAARGFIEIATNLQGLLNEGKYDSPAKLLAALLGKPEYVDKIALYSVGDQSRLADALGEHKPKGDPRAVASLSRFLGYWLWDSLLRYPGVLVNEVAASSYLNLSQGDFNDPKILAVFEEALYRGPFKDEKRPSWWRGMLDDILSREGFESGLAFVQGKVKPTAKRSECYVDPSIPAGYYCIIKRLPVSLKNSKGGISWFPRGADLTRIGIKTFEEYGPWLGA